MMKDGAELSWHQHDTIIYKRNMTMHEVELRWKAMTTYEAKLRWHYIIENEKQWECMK